MVWTQYTGGGGAAALGGDHFSPRFLVGSALRGAPAPSMPGYFRWIRDPGDGTGIALALTEIALLGFAVDLCIQPGTYTRAPGLTRFILPANCRAYGQDIGGVNIVTNDTDDCIWQLGAGATLEQMTLTQRGTLAAAGAALIEAPAGSASARTRIRAVRLTTPVSVLGLQLVGGSFEMSSLEFSFTGGGAAPRFATIEGAAGNPASFFMENCRSSLPGTGAVRFGFAGDGTAVRDARILGNRFELAAGIVPIAAGAGADGCLAQGNVSRGSGSTLPTDAGTNNSINPGVANYWGA